MAKVLFLSPPYLDLYGKLNRAAGRYFPLGIAYIASYIRKYGGHQVSMFEPEAQGLSYEDLTALIQKTAPDVIGLTCSTPNFYRAMEIARLARKVSSARIVLGGVHASALPEFVLGKYAELLDCVVVGEGEVTMLEVVAAYASGKSPEGIPGTVVLKDGQVFRAACRPYLDDLDSLPFPARDLIPQDLFMPNLHNARHRRSISILTSRGCPFNCSFCASRLVSGKKYRMHSADYVLEEMELAKREYGARQLLITDDTFTLNHERLVAICEGMIRRRLRLEWFCFSQVTVVTRDILAVMRRAGCYNIGYGVESADENILKAMGKPIKPERAIEAVQLANEAGMKTQAFYIFGSPGETRQQMEETVRFASRVNSTLAFFNMLVPFPGTKEFEHYFAATPLEEINWENFVAVGEACVLGNAQVPAAEIEGLIARANISYYLRPLRIFRLLWQIRTLFEFMNYVRGGFGLFRQVAGWLRRRK